MDKYKKKSLKFMGFGRELRTAELNSLRATGRHQRFSTLRELEIPKENEEPQTDIIPIKKLPTIVPIKKGLPRKEMLEKWKQEKFLKKKQEESKLKPFKAGSLAIKVPFVVSLDKRSFQGSFKKQDSMTQDSSSKALIAKVAKNKQDSTTQDSSSRAPIAKVATNKDTGKQVSATRTQIKLVNPKVQKRDTLPQPLINKAPIKTLDSKIKRELQPRTTTFGFQAKQQTNSIAAAANAKSKIPFRGTSKPIISRIPNKRIDQKPTEQSRIGKGISKTNSIQVKATGNVKVDNLTKLKVTPPPEENSNKSPIAESFEKNITFRCNVSVIEPDIGIKSFAPEGYLFKPPAESEDWLSDVFTRLRFSRETNRTSTPKQSDLSLSKMVPDGNQYSKQSLDSPTLTDNPEVASTSPNNSCSDVKQSLSFDPPENTSEKSVLPDTVPVEDKGILHHSSDDVLSDAKQNIPTDIRSVLETRPNSPEFSLSKIEFLKIITPKVSETELQTSKLPSPQKQPKIDSSGVLLPEPSLLLNTEKKDTNLFEFSLSKIDRKLLSSSMETAIFINEQPLLQDQLQADVSTVPEKQHKIDSLVLFPETELLPETGFLPQTEQLPEYGLLPETGHLPETGLLPNTEQKETDLFEFGLSKIEDKLLNSSMETTVFVKEQPLLQDQADVSALPEKHHKMDSQSSFSKSITMIDVGNKTRRYRQSVRPQLENINEGFEKTPSTTPRRSLRLANLRQFESPENIFSVRRPTFFGSPNGEYTGSKSNACGLKYDFEELHLESASQMQQRPQRRSSSQMCSINTGKVSLLYTPPRRGRNSNRVSIKEDLMSFSPNT